MPELTPSGHDARIVWLGVVAARAESIRSAPRARLSAGFGGIAGDAHAGLTRAACTRAAPLHPRGCEIRNTRQLSIVAAEELAEIARALDLEALDPAWLGATMVVEGIPDFSHLPPASRLQAPAGTTLVVDLQNRPCQYPAREIERERPGRGRAFLAAARGRRGVTAWVERAGPLALGDALRLFIPDQRPWAHQRARPDAACG
ncbi:MAG: hypothetical protein Kow0058_05410 [Roseovarius sp.]